MLFVEEMIRGLTQVHWERVDVSFQKSKQRYTAHSTIQVKFLSYSFPAKLVDAILNYFINPALDERAFVIQI